MPCSNEKLTRVTADIVSSYLAGNKVAAEDIGPLISTVHGSLTSLKAPALAGAAGPARARAGSRSAAQINASIEYEHLVSLIDGRRYKVLRWHLKRHGHTPETYRAAFGLPDDYPMVAPAYSALRAEIGKKPRQV